MFEWLKNLDSCYLERPEGFDETALSWEELRDLLNDLNRMERGYAARNVTEVLKRLMDRVSEMEGKP